MSQLVARFISASIALPGLLAASAAFGATPMKTDAGKLVHWEAHTITIARDQNHPSHSLAAAAIDLAIDEAAAAWNAMPEMQVRFTRSPNNEAKEPAMVLVQFCAGKWSGKPRLLGQTAFEADKGSGLVQAATVAVNECDFRFVGPEDVAPDHMDLQAVLTHELGHVLGLDHTGDPEAVMHSCTGTIANRRPNADDRRGISLIYRTNTSLPPVALRPKPDVQPSPVFLTGQNGMLGFELPWPELSSVHPVRFVPTVVPLPPSRAQHTALKAGAKHATKTLRPTSDTAVRQTSHASQSEMPKATEVDWSALEPSKRETRGPGRAPEASRSSNVRR